jgi:hypothetical protein
MPSIASSSMLVTVKSPDGARLLADDELDELTDEELEADDRLELDVPLDALERLLDDASALLDEPESALADDGEPDDPDTRLCDDPCDTGLDDDASEVLFGIVDELELSPLALLDDEAGGSSTTGAGSSTVSGAASAQGSHSTGGQQAPWPGYGGYGGYGAYGA